MRLPKGTVRPEASNVGLEVPRRARFFASLRMTGGELKDQSRAERSNGASRTATKEISGS